MENHDDPDTAFGRVAISKGYATQDQVRAAYQELQAYKGKGQNANLAQVLTLRGMISAAQAELIWKEVSRSRSQPAGPIPSDIADQLTEKVRGADVRKPAQAPKSDTTAPFKGVMAVPPVKQGASPNRGDTLKDLDPGKAMEIGPQTQNEMMAAMVAPVQPTAQKQKRSRGSSRGDSQSDGRDAAAREAQRKAEQEQAAQYLSHDDYEPIKVLGAGGMGAVLLCKHRKLDRLVAVKVMLIPQKASAKDIEIAGKRFDLEAKVTAQVEHPNVITVYERGADKWHRQYLAMKVVDGVTLQELIRRHHGEEKFRRQFPLRRLLELFIQLCRGMAHVHDKGIIHRDLKPANVMADGGVAKVMDFGLGKEVSAPELPVPSYSQSGEKDRPVGVTCSLLTEEGMIMGTPVYMSPEQAAGNLNLDQRSDVYALGAILYELLTGVAPVDGNSPINILKKVCVGEILPPRLRTPEKQIPRELNSIVMKAMARFRDSDHYKFLEQQGHVQHMDPANLLFRYQTAKELIADLERYLNGEEVQAHRYTSKERFQRAVGKHGQKFAVGAGLAITLLFFSLIWLGSLNAKERERAAESGRRAEAEQKLRETADTAREAAVTAQAETTKRLEAEQRARAVAEEALQKARNRARATELSHQAFQRIQLRDPDGSIQLLRQAIEVDPTFYDGYFTLARLYQLTGQFQTAVEEYGRCYETARQEGVAYPRALLLQGQLQLHAINNAEAAKTTFARAVGLPESNAYTLACLAYVAALNGDVAEAERRAEQARRKDAFCEILVTNGYVLHLKAAASNDQEVARQASNYYAEAIRSEERCYTTLNSRGKLLLEQLNDVPGAINDLNAAIQYLPRWAPGYVNKTRALIRANRLDEARQTLETAERALPPDQMAAIRELQQQLNR